MTIHQFGRTWFLAQFKPNCHRIAERNLVRQGFQSFLPMQEETRRVRGKFTTFMRPLFPGYLFVAFDKAHGGWQAVNSTYGITRLVSAGKTPVEVPLNLVSQLMQRCDTTGKLLPPKLLSPGDQVIINKGPFVEFIATIEALASDRRVWVLLEFMGQKTRVAVPANQLRTV
jgi:transcriptional antiterminator RfaH